MNTTMTRKELEKYKGMTVQHMELCCPHVLQLIKSVATANGGYPMMYDAQWWPMDFAPAYNDHLAYFPTEAQLDAYYAPKSKFEVGSVWLSSIGVESPFVLEFIEPKDTLGSHDYKYEVIWRDERTCKTTGGSFSHSSIMSSAIPFYAPPTQAKLKEWGKVIDRIGVPEAGMCVCNIHGYMIESCDNSFKTSKKVRFNGLRYILKDAVDPKKKAILDEIKELAYEMTACHNAFNAVLARMDELK
jgi:hypothetical protein